MMDLRHLRAFVAVAEELHFGRAAARLQLSPSPVSRTVMELEHELQVTLFDRGHHRVDLTPAGAELLTQARDLLASWDAFAAHGRILGRDLAVKRFRVGVATLAPPLVVDIVMAELSAVRPRVRVELEFGPSSDLVAALRAGRLDVAISLLPIYDADLRTVALGHYRFQVVLRDSHPLAARAEIGVADLRGHHVMLPTPTATSTTQTVAAWLEHNGARVDQLPDMDLARLALVIRHGSAVTVTGQSGFATEIFQQEGLTAVPMHDAGPRVETGLVWRRTGATPLVEALTARLEAVGAAGTVGI